jgi:hypothetical protein
MSDFTVSQVARKFNVAPRTISDLFYGRHLDDTLCPIVSGRRFIPQEYLPTIEAVLRERNLLREPVGASS